MESRRQTRSGSFVGTSDDFDSHVLGVTEAHSFLGQNWKSGGVGQAADENNCCPKRKHRSCYSSRSVSLKLSYAVTGGQVGSEGATEGAGRLEVALKDIDSLWRLRDVVVEKFPQFRGEVLHFFQPEKQLEEKPIMRAERKSPYVTSTNEAPACHIDPITPQMNDPNSDICSISTGPAVTTVSPISAENSVFGACVSSPVKSNLEGDDGGIGPSDDGENNERFAGVSAEKSVFEAYVSSQLESNLEDDGGIGPSADGENDERFPGVSAEKSVFEACVSSPVKSNREVDGGIGSSADGENGERFAGVFDACLSSPLESNLEVDDGEIGSSADSETPETLLAVDDGEISMYADSEWVGDSDDDEFYRGTLEGMTIPEAGSMKNTAATCGGRDHTVEIGADGERCGEDGEIREDNRKKDASGILNSPVHAVSNASVIQSDSREESGVPISEKDISGNAEGVRAGLGRSSRRILFDEESWQAYLFELCGLNENPIKSRGGEIGGERSLESPVEMHVEIVSQFSPVLRHLENCSSKSENQHRAERSLSDVTTAATPTTVSHDDSSTSGSEVDFGGAEASFQEDEDEDLEEHFDEFRALIANLSRERRRAAAERMQKDGILNKNLHSAGLSAQNAALFGSESREILIAAARKYGELRYDYQTRLLDGNIEDETSDEEEEEQEDDEDEENVNPAGNGNNPPLNGNNANPPVQGLLPPNQNFLDGDTGNDDTRNPPLIWGVVPDEEEACSDVYVVSCMVRGACLEIRRDRDVALEVVKHCGDALRYFVEDNPELQKDRELALAAVRQNGLALEHVHRDLRRSDREIVETAILEDGYALQWIMQDDEESEFGSDEEISEEIIVPEKNSSTRNHGSGGDYTDVISTVNPQESSSSSTNSGIPDTSKRSRVTNAIHHEILKTGTACHGKCGNVHHMERAIHQCHPEKNLGTPKKPPKDIRFLDDCDDFQCESDNCLSGNTTHCRSYCHASKYPRVTSKVAPPALSLSPNMCGRRKSQSCEGNFCESESSSTNPSLNDPNFALHKKYGSCDHDGARITLTREKAEISAEIVGTEQVSPPEFTKERKTTTLNPQPSSLNPQSSTLNSEFSSFRKDRELMLAVVSRDGFSPQSSTLNPQPSTLNPQFSSFRKDRELMLAVVSRDGFSLQYVHKSLRKDREIVFAALKDAENVSLLDWADPELRKDRDFIAQVIQEIDHTAFLYAQGDITRDEDLIMLALEKNERIHLGSRSCYMGSDSTTSTTISWWNQTSNQTSTRAEKPAISPLEVMYPQLRARIQRLVSPGEQRSTLGSGISSILDLLRHSHSVRKLLW